MIEILNKRGGVYECRDTISNSYFISKPEDLCKQLDFILDPPLQVGNLVKIIDPGYNYSTYSDWILKHLPYEQGVFYQYGIMLRDTLNGKDPTFKILAIAPHDDFKDETLAAIMRVDDSSSKVYLINVKGLEKCEK